MSDSDRNDDRGGVWDAVVDAFRTMAPVVERRSRYGDKPALTLHGREVAHCETPGIVDLRVTGQGWRTLPEQVRSDPRLRRHPGRRDWVELRVDTPADVVALEVVIRAVTSAND